MTILDWVLVVVWTGITLAGFFKGAIRIVFGLGGLALGVWLSVVTGADVAEMIAAHVPQHVVAVGLGYLVPWLVVSVLCAIAGWGMERALDALGLGCVNRVLGAALAGVAAAVVLGLLLLTVVRLSPEIAAVEHRSVLLEWVERAVEHSVDDADAGPPRPSSTATPDADEATPPAAEREPD
ncbi:MAG: CvpA family protein [Holophagae bacterium]|jgi:membrane protein required for colicin V production